MGWYWAPGPAAACSVGFDIVDFPAAGGAGIAVASGGNAVQASDLGVQPDGSTAAGNTGGILITGSNNTIGGEAPGAGDLISGNTTYGVNILGPGSSGNVVEGDDIGTSADGTVALGNGADDLVIENGADNNWIGVNQQSGPDRADQGNVIAGGLSVGLSVGVLIQGSGTTGNVVAGNLIGLNVDSQGQVIDGLGNGFAGVWIIGGASGNWIGVNAAAGPGTEDALQRNVISGSNNGVGLADAGTTGNVVAGNLIGTDPTGTAAVPNQTYEAPQSSGVYISAGASSNLVGTTGQDGAVADALERNVISGNTLSGVIIVDQGGATTGNVVAGNDIGTTADGTAALGNSNGVVIGLGASDNWVGVNSVYGPENADQGNLISGNSNDGVYITSADTANNVVAGNDIGTDVTGTRALPNAGHGVAIYDGPQDNIIGTSGDGVADALERNVISGNGQDGVAIDGTTAATDDNVVAGNDIGTDVTGTRPLGNQARGVEVLGMASSNRIGVNPGDVGASAEGNVISANQGFGVWIWQGASSNVVAGNLIGTDVSGTVALANSVGVLVADGAQNNWIGVNPVYGPENADQRNIISGNTGAGVQFADAGTTGNTVAGNRIGTDISGSRALGNVLDGILIDSGASDNTVGGTSVGAGNLISANSNGVEIYRLQCHRSSRATLIGLDQTGTLALGNCGAGVLVDAGSAANTIGGDVGGARNVISGNAEGVMVTGAATTGTLIAGNLIGTDVEGAIAVGNLSAGIDLAGGTATTIGGTTASDPQRDLGERRRRARRRKRRDEHAHPGQLHRNRPDRCQGPGQHRRRTCRSMSRRAPRSAAPPRAPAT